MSVLSSKPVVLLALTALALPASAQDTAPPENATLSVRVTHVRSDEGNVCCALYDSDRGWPIRSHLARATSIVRPHGGRALCRFADTPPGRYAVAVFHDEDGNGELNSRGFGRPTEGWGVSGGDRGGVFRGPSYERALFDWNGEGSVGVGLGY